MTGGIPSLGAATSPGLPPHTPRALTRRRRPGGRPAIRHAGPRWYAPGTRPGGRLSERGAGWSPSFPEAFSAATPRAWTSASRSGSRTPAGRDLFPPLPRRRRRRPRPRGRHPGPLSRGNWAVVPSSARRTARRHPLQRRPLLRPRRLPGPAPQAPCRPPPNARCGARATAPRPRHRHRDRPSRCGDLLGELHAAVPDGDVHQGASAYKAPRRWTTATPGRPACGTSPWKAAASSSAPASTCAASALPSNVHPVQGDSPRHRPDRRRLRSSSPRSHEVLVRSAAATARAS